MKLFPSLTRLAAIAAASIVAAACSGSGGFSYSIAYDISFQSEDHYICAEMTYVPENLDREDVRFSLPVWAPGYYVIVDYPKYLTDFAACDSSGKPLSWRKSGKNVWIVETADTVKVSYRIYADAWSIAESRVQGDIAFIAPNGVFMYADGDTDHPVDITVRLPEQWTRISTALPRDGEGVFHAPDFDVLYDSPMLIGNHYSRTYTHEGHDYEFALETPEGFEDTPMAEDFFKFVSQCSLIFGDVPYDSYHLLLMREGRGGLEHQASQACYTAGKWDFATREEYLEELRFFCHEYFHNYNVKAIRPIELGPFDYDREVFTPMLWVSEGFTCYYESLLLVRAGVQTMEEHLDYLSGFIRDLETSEGQKHMSLRQSSYDIWLNFFNTAANGRDVRISYYVKGPVMGLVFDAVIRNMTSGERCLDDLMRLLYDRYYKEKGRGFTEGEFWTAAEEVAGGVLEDLRLYVDTTRELDYNAILEPVGITLDSNGWVLRAIE